MKALEFTGYGDLKSHLRMGERDKPAISPGQLLIEIHAASINPIDFKIVSGALKLALKFPLPSTLGYDVAGKVVDKADDVSGFNIGDDVYARVPSNTPGTIAEYIAVDASVVAAKPYSLSFIEAASLPLVGLTSIQCLEWAGIKTGDRVLIHAGSGGIGTFAIQYAKAKGAEVYTTTSTDNCPWVKGLGADHVIDYRQENYLDVAKDLDIVFDTLGGDYTEQAFSIVKPNGHVVSIAGPLDDPAAKYLGLNPLFRFILRLKRQAIVRLSKTTPAAYRYVFMQPNAEQLRLIGDLVEQQAIKPVVDRVFNLEHAIDALVYLQSGRAKGKVVINVR